MTADWRHKAQCRHHDPELWTREKRADAIKDAKAKAICNRCPVKQQCRDWAETHTVYGIWGGISYGLKRLQQAKLPDDYDGHSFRSST